MSVLPAVNLFLLLVCYGSREFLLQYFRDAEGQDVLLFVDNIFRFTQAGAEVSALLGRIPSAVGYQPTLATDMGMLQVSDNVYLNSPGLDVFRAGLK